MNKAELISQLELVAFMTTKDENITLFFVDAIHAINEILEGYSIVPDEPTKAMIQAARESISGSCSERPLPENFTITGAMYKAMLEANKESEL
tara:strand:+ start:282 stop:560 length:279 start_codon:yes stop_codon:yes gene_type:complete